MRKFALILAAAGLTASLWAQAPHTALRPEQTILLYAASAQGLQDPVQGTPASAGFKAVYSNHITVPETYNDWGDVRNISALARFDLYRPARPNGKMVVILPGGGYGYVSAYNEGIYAAEWLVRRGYTAAVLKYRLPNGVWQVPLEDVHRTLEYCRAHAQQWGITRIGILGGSAGGHLAALASNLYESDVQRPDFSVLLYPVISLEEGLTHAGSMKQLTGGDAALVRKLSMQYAVSAATPPAFIVLSDNDKVVNPRNSTLYYNALKQQGIPSELHIYPAGGHGWGFYTSEYGKDRLGEENRYLMLRSLEDFLKSR